MGKFEFKNRTIELDIAGNKFSVEADTRTGDKMKQYEKTAQEMADNNASNQEALDFCKKVMDEVLGKGAVNVIFKGREVLLDDCVDILVYVSGEVVRFRKAAQNVHEQ